jgi:transcriptional regulator with XRE-family HTH domain
MSQIVFIVEKTNTGFSAYAEDFDKYSVGTTGDTIPELKKNILEALNSHLDSLGKKNFSEDHITIKYDLPQFFEYYSEISAKGVAKRVGINPALLSQYVNGKKTPSDKQVRKILIGVQELGRELATLELV